MVTPFEFVSNYIHTIGWAAIITAAVTITWRVSQFVAHAKDRGDAGDKALVQINDMATNHFPHMQKSLENLDVKTTDGNESLKEIATGIAVLVDRGRS
jgi:hypothetical protein